MLRRYRSLPPQYRILPAEMDQVIPGFEAYCQLPRGQRSNLADNVYPNKVLAIRRRDCRQWFYEFMDRILSDLGKRYLPVCRMSDGEYSFMFGEQPPDVRWPFWKQLSFIGRRELRRLLGNRQFNAFTSDLYHSGSYSEEEQKQIKQQYTEWLKRIAEKGILALHLTYGTHPFQERYHPALKRWLDDSRIELTDANYYPFYFVYAAATGLRRHELLQGRRVLVVNGSNPKRQAAIEVGLRREGVQDVGWCPISERRSLYDRIDPSPFLDRYDLAVVGAGIGKPNILLQLEPLQIPCLDVGFVFSVWQNPETRWQRPCCALPE